MVLLTKLSERQRKKLPKLVQNRLNEIKEELQENPELGQLMKGNFQGIYKTKFNRNPEYRLLYSVTQNDDESEIIILFVATRETMNNIYRLPKKRIQKYLDSPIVE